MSSSNHTPPNDSVSEPSTGGHSCAARVSEIVFRTGARPLDLVREIETLEREFGPTVYAELLFLMAHLCFDAEEARTHWQRILEIRGNMEQRLGAQVDVRVALVNYFINVNRKLENPKIIELKLFQETQASVYRDDLTGLHNYRYLREHLAKELDRNQRYDSSVSLLMVDIDDFKAFNDEFGHLAGNRALTSVARILEETIRTSDTAVRYGGEEFVLILPETSKMDSMTVAERIRERVEKHMFLPDESQRGTHLTVSLGVATYPVDAGTADELIRGSDSAMYLAKSRGKNRVCLFGEDRRSHRRIDAELEGYYCELSADYHPFTTIDVSEGGLLLHANRNLRVGSLIDVKLRLPGDADEIACAGRVVRVEEEEDGKYNAAIRIVNISNRDRFRLGKFLRTEVTVNQEE